MARVSRSRGLTDRGTAWQARVRRKDTRGTVRYRVRSFPYDAAASATGRHGRATVRAQAEAWATAERLALRLDQRPASELDGAQSLGGWIQRYATDSDVIRKGGHSRECSMLRRVGDYAPTLLSRPILDLTADDFRDLTQAMAALRPGTVARYLTAIDSVWKASRRWGFSIPSPLAGMARPAAHDERERVITAAEWRAINAALAAVSPPVRACIAWLRATGCRRGESCALLWSDIDRSTNPATAHLRAATTKTGRARFIPLLPDAVAALRLVRGGKVWPASGRVFQCQPDSVGLAWRRAVERAGIADARLHDLRHTRLTEICAIMPMADAMKLSGHRTPRMLLRYYNPDAAELGRRLLAGERKARKR